MTSGSLVSVVTIFLDEERFIGEAVESVRRQPIATGSFSLSTTDLPMGPAIARAYASEDPRVRYLTHPNAGAPRNGAIA